MCIICVSPKRVRQPNVTTIRRMFRNNPDGAGYMVARDGKVTISKGFMDFDEYIEAIRAEHFTAKDPVVYHFRFSTQAGVNPEMTSNRIEHMKVLDVECSCGVAHNGIIRLTTDRNNHEYSDTALFIANYLSLIIREPGDLKDERVLKLIHRLAGSKLAIMDADGYIATVGEYINQKGLLFSNASFETDTYYRRFR